MATTKILFVQLYAVFVTICLVVSAVSTTKKKMKTTNAIKKAKALKHYSANPNDYFSSDMNAFSFTVEGEPLSLKRVATGKGGVRYDSQKWTKKSFDKAYKKLNVIHSAPLCKLGTDEVKVDTPRVVYCMYPITKNDNNNDDGDLSIVDRVRLTTNL